MVAYDINVIPVLHKKAVSAKASDEKTFEEFKKILDTALENVSKINAVQYATKPMPACLFYLPMREWKIRLLRWRAGFG